MRSDAKTVEEYLDQLPDDRREALSEIRDFVLAALPNGIEEEMRWGMISYSVPLSMEPDTYNGEPLMYAALASQKNHMSLYLSAIYTDDDARRDFEARYRATGKKYDVGKSCVRFRKVEDLPLELIGEAIGRFEVDDFVSIAANRSR